MKLVTLKLSLIIYAPFVALKQRVLIRPLCELWTKLLIMRNRPRMLIEMKVVRLNDKENKFKNKFKKRDRSEIKYLFFTQSYFFYSLRC